MVAAEGNSTSGATDIINETDGTVAHIESSAGVALAANWQTKAAIAGNALYLGVSYNSGPNSKVDVYYGIHGLTTESSADQYRSFAYGVFFVAGSGNPVEILGTASGTGQITSLAVTPNTSTADGKSNTIYVGTTSGLSVIQEVQGLGNPGGTGNTHDGTEEFSGSVKYYTKGYISEEMVGAIRGMWPMDLDGASNATYSGTIAAGAAVGDVSTGNNDVYVNNATTVSLSSGVRDQGLTFNGTSNYLSCTNAVCGATTQLDSGGTTWSFGAWYKTSANTGVAQRIIDKYGNAAAGVGAYELTINTANQLAAAIENSAATIVTAVDSTTSNDGNWHFATATYDGANLKLYRDGQLVAQTATTITIADGTSNFGIGANATGTSNLFFNGSLDEPFVTATTVSAGQIKHMYEVGARALQSHASTLGTTGNDSYGNPAADRNQRLGFISTGTNTVGDARPDYNNQFMYVGLNSTSLGGLSKVQLNSDTNIKTYNAAANVPTGGTLLIDEDVNTVAVGYNLEAVGSAASGVKSMAPDNNSNALTGSLFSKTQTLNSSTKFAYLWTSFVTDSSDASNGINVYACNNYSTKALCDSNSAWVLGSIVMTDSTQSPPEREYTFTFPNAGSNLTFKFDFARGSTKTNTYIARYGTTWSSSIGGADIAERYHSNEPAYPGDILVIDTPPVGGDAAVSLSRTPYDQKILGVVTTNPGIVMDNNLVDLNFNAASRNSPDKPAVALAGRIPVNVSTKNGPILVGDGITSSEIAGVGVKSLQAGQIVAKALNNFDCTTDGAVKETDGTCQGQVMAIINVTYFQPNLQFADVNSFSITPGSPVSTNSGNLASAAANLPFKIVRITTDGASEVVDQIGTFASLVAANIKSGAIITQDFVADNVVAQVIHTNIISPLPGGTDVTVKIGSEATPSGKFAIQNSTGTEVASIDNLGNATFSGVVRSQNIDAIQALLNQVATDQNVLLAATSSSDLTASTSANLASLITSDLYVTNQAAVNSLSVTKSVTIGSDLVFSSDLDQLTNQPINSINTLSAPLKIQSLAMAPVEIMDGLVTIDTHGNVNIAGNLTVAGKITTPELDAGLINATGSATLNSVTTPQLVVAAPDATAAGTIVNGVITTNSTVGKATIPAGTSEITIKNPKVTDYTLVYVTPTSSTQNYVLYVKSKVNGQFVVGFDNPLSVDVSFNWWIVQVQN